MKRILALVLVLFLLIPLEAFAIVQKSSLIYVTDEASVLTEETKNYITYYSSFLQKEKSIQYYVVTVSNLGNYEVEDYAKSVMKSFGLSQKSILVLLAKGDRKVHISFGEELGKIMTKEETSSYIQDYFMPYFKNDEWDKGIKNGYIAFYKKICTHYNIDTTPMKTENPELIIKYKQPILMAILFVSAFISSIFCDFFKKRYKKEKYHSMDYIKFSLTLFINILLIMIAYFLEPKTIFAILIIEILSIIVVFGGWKSTTMEEAYQKKKKSTNKKKIQRRK